MSLRIVGPGECILNHHRGSFFKHTCFNGYTCRSVYNSGDRNIINSAYVLLTFKVCFYVLLTFKVCLYIIHSEVKNTIT